MNSTRIIIYLLAVFVPWIALSSADLDCDTHNGHTCSSDGRCIPFPFICDGENDCADGSDEQDCNNDSFGCGEDDFKCQTHHQCIPLRWRCDGDHDCFDDSDEQTCENVTCRDSHISCGPGQRCIDKTFLCDGHPDCPDESDELLEMCQNRTCQNNDFRCERTHRCIVNRWRCDGDDDCDDGSDERNCQSKQCSDAEWQCKGSRDAMMCIPTFGRCDGSYDCADRSDELDCPAVSPSQHCLDNTFACHVGSECIHREWLCDLDWDCSDGSDEQNCSTHTCGSNQFQCRDDGYCILSSLKCDGTAQCGDGSDELDCEPKTSCRNDTEFNCNRVGHGAAFCISVDFLCDGTNNCGRFEDEDPHLCNRSIDNPCNHNNSGCAHTCVFTHVSHHCECNAGYRLLSDGKGCADIDECALNNTCSHGCENKKGSFKCSCKPGYLLDPYNHINCLATGDEPELMFTSYHEVRVISVRSGGYHAALRGPVNAVLVDYDIATSSVFYSVKNLGSIHWSNRSNANQTSRNLTDSIPNIGGLAFDWVHRNLYWTDSGRGTVEVLSLADGTATNTWHRTLISTDLEEPKSIIVDPRNNSRMLYWSDCGSKHPKIERSYLDGSQASRQPLVTRGITCPNGLTLDYETDTLYWVDMKLHAIVSLVLASQKRTLLLTSFTYLGHPVALTTFEDYVYWADAKTESLFKMSKLRNVTGESNTVTRVAGHLKTLTDVDIFHRLRQPAAANACSSRTCSHICLPVLSYPGYVCACPNDNSTTQYKLDTKGFTCIVTQNSVPDVPQGSSNSSGLSQPDKMTMKEMDIGGVIGAVIGSLCAAVLLLTACLWLVRKYRRRNIKSLKFDNPVYRTKAAEDQFSISNEQSRPSAVFPASSEPLNSSSTENIITSEQL